MPTPFRSGSRRSSRVAVALVAALTAACSASSNNLVPEIEEEVNEELPTVVSMAPSALPGFDRELYKATCQTATGECPVVRWEGVDYVALSFRDNRGSFALHAFDAAGSTLGVREEVGARYLAAVQIVAEARSVIFVGQDDRTVTLGWETLRGMR